MAKTTLEVIAPNVEEAISRGMDQLGVSRDSLIIEIIDSGTAGFLGIGSRQARVRLTVNLAQVDQQVAPVISEPDSLPEKKPNETCITVDPTQAASAPLSSDTSIILEKSQTVVRDLLENMKVRASVSGRVEEPGEPGEQPHFLVEIQGDDLSVLIGRRSETLNALQYVAGMIVTKDVGHWVNLIIDVQGYRNRRERQLRLLAVKLAEQAVNTGRRQVLEPMPANERRIIHLELSHHPNVNTESIGEEPNRKISIYVKK